MTTSEIENAAERPAEIVRSDSAARNSRSLRSRIILFVTVFVFVLLAANWFVCATWNHFLEMTVVPVWEIIFPGLTLAFIAATFWDGATPASDCGLCIGFLPSGWVS